MDKLLISSTFLICRQDGKVVANCAPMDIIGISSDVAAGYARRLVACWNACEGISTEFLKRGIVSQIAENMKAYIADRDRLQALNAELVAAMSNLLSMLPSDHSERPDTERIPAGYCYVRWIDIREARTALAKAKETVK